MASNSEVLTALIDEMDAIERFAGWFQEENPKDGSAATPEDVTKLRTWYLDWYAKSRAMLNESGRNAFDHHYSAAGYNIHRYITDPVTTFYGRRKGSAYQASTYSYHQWKNDYEKNFRDQFNQQRIILMQVRSVAKVLEATPTPPPPPTFDTIRLHPRVRAVSGQLFKDGHYRQAIFRSCVALNGAVQERSGRPDLDGIGLMQHVFSMKSPILKFEGHPDEQQGYMWLFSGLIMAIRNPRAHVLGESEDLDANEAVEMLALISVLFRALDSANRAESPSGS